MVALFQAIEPKRERVFGATNLRVEWGNAVVEVGEARMRKLRVAKASTTGGASEGYGYTTCAGRQFGT
jgi:hypothetical protein